jgi:hypothetical protein
MMTPRRSLGLARHMRCLVPSARYLFVPSARYLLVPSARRLRVAVYFTVVFLGASLLAARALQARVTEAAFAFGRELSGLSDLTAGAEGIIANGHHFRHASTSTADGVAGVMDRLEAHCRANPGLVAGALDELLRSRPERVQENAAPRALRHGVLRDDDAERGTLICFTGQTPGSLDGLVDAAERFASTLDLSSVGSVLYAYAERQGDGQTHVVTLWTQTGLDLAALFPTRGDAAGDDSRVLPRPDNARRVLSAAADGMPFGLCLYETRNRLADVQRSYDAWMHERGWQRIARPDAADTTAYLRPDGYQAFVTLSTAGDLTYVAATEAGRREGSSITTHEVKE